MIDGVTFDNINTYDKWGFFIVTKTIGIPEPKTYKVDIPGGNGSIDVTEAVLGSVAYNDRPITIRLRATGEQGLWSKVFTEMQDKLQGKKMNIIFPDDLGYYYKGRLNITSFKNNFDIANVEISCDCEPFKYEINAYGSNWLWDPFDFETGVIYDDTKTISGNTTVTIETLKMPVTPSFRADRVMTLICEGSTYTLPANTEITFYELVLTEGSHALTFKCSGTGTVKISFTNGVL